MFTYIRLFAFPYEPEESISGSTEGHYHSKMDPTEVVHAVPIMYANRLKTFYWTFL